MDQAPQFKHLQTAWESAFAGSEHLPLERTGLDTSLNIGQEFLDPLYKNDIAPAKSLLALSIPKMNEIDAQVRNLQGVVDLGKFNSADYSASISASYKDELMQMTRKLFETVEALSKQLSLLDLSKEPNGLQNLANLLQNPLNRVEVIDFQAKDVGLVRAYHTATQNRVLMEKAWEYERWLGAKSWTWCDVFKEMANLDATKLKASYRQSPYIPKLSDTYVYSTLDQKKGLKFGLGSDPKVGTDQNLVPLISGVPEATVVDGAVKSPQIDSSWTNGPGAVARMYKDVYGWETNVEEGFAMSFLWTVHHLMKRAALSKALPKLWDAEDNTLNALRKHLDLQTRVSRTAVELSWLGREISFFASKFQYIKDKLTATRLQLIDLYGALVSGLDYNARCAAFDVRSTIIDIRYCCIDIASRPKVAQPVTGGRSFWSSEKRTITGSALAMKDKYLYSIPMLDAEFGPQNLQVSRQLSSTQVPYIGTTSGNRVYGAGIDWIVPPMDVLNTVQEGQIDTQGQTPSATGWTFPVTLNQRFPNRPQVHAWFTLLDKQANQDFNLELFIENVTEREFRLSIRKPANHNYTQIQVQWVAFSKDNKRVWGTSHTVQGDNYFAMDKENPAKCLNVLNMPFAPDRWYTFPKDRFEEPPRYIAGLRGLKMEASANLRITCDITGVTRNGITVRATPWADTKLKSATFDIICMI